MPVPKNVDDAAHSLTQLISHDKQMTAEWKIVADHLYSNEHTDETEDLEEIKRMLAKLDDKWDGKFCYLATGGDGWGILQLRPNQKPSRRFLSGDLLATKEKAIEWLKEETKPTLQERVKEYLDGHNRSTVESDDLLKELLKSIEEKASAKEKN